MYEFVSEFHSKQLHGKKMIYFDGNFRTIQKVFMCTVYN